ncbi:hypothetical protein [Tatumella sp. UBA2305]|uniref:hypothetical protein n=1 Tax=Tatumella sp. UBA2305 TaxID=1947647 RepID=UPI002600C19E|nr:hypothetical protein [Tatumella sp. UBA2305]
MQIFLTHLSDILRMFSDNNHNIEVIMVRLFKIAAVLGVVVMLNGCIFPPPGGGGGGGWGGGGHGGGGPHYGYNGH